MFKSGTDTTSPPSTPPRPAVYSQTVGDVGVVVVGVLELQTERAGGSVAGVQGLLGDQPHVVGVRHVEVTGVVEDNLRVNLAAGGRNRLERIRKEDGEESDCGKKKNEKEKNETKI